MECRSNCSCNLCLDGWDFTSDGKCACTRADYEVDAVTGECVPITNSVICEYDTYENAGVCETCNAQCLSCSGPDANQCLSCAEGLEKTADGTGF